MAHMKVHCDNRLAMFRLGRMKSAATDFRPVFQWARLELARSYKENFDSSGLPVGGWSPLKPQYAAWKAIHFPGAPIMVRTGSLLRSVSTLTGAGNRIHRTKAEFSTNIEYAKFHQYGTSKMAKRMVMFEPPLFARNLAAKAKDHIVDAANGIMRIP